MSNRLVSQVRSKVRKSFSLEGVTMHSVFRKAGSATCVTLARPAWVAGCTDRHSEHRMDESCYSESVARRLKQYLPVATSWVLEQERFILENGVPLSDVQLADAKLVGVVKPERVRLFRVEQIPLPQLPELEEMKEAMNLTAPALTGLALRYGIYLRANLWGQRRFVVHELVHTAQYERLEGARAFLECYLYKCLAIGPTSAPMEQEAVAVTQRICGLERSSSMPKTSSAHPPPARSTFIRMRGQR